MISLTVSEHIKSHQSFFEPEKVLGKKELHGAIDLLYALVHTCDWKDDKKGRTEIKQFASKITQAQALTEKQATL